ncbi:MAG: hypothetical protein KJ676_06750 [Alphaproteobacteria bacterium]|nr:hypothetical protein [Alphaproteobacteria bacterium]MBU1526202.1 hypothetical protein [Alphaproteobacteria bacterium]MBU2117493.1 hypothetical protein [Alphaproteobacteria bacterium]MBU2350554.1 hypothetical protein [Alphaproteobacteria bacterium]MBU2382119.1 hypothetical protein [Alphaproteobacteria bacterium]
MRAALMAATALFSLLAAPALAQTVSTSEKADTATVVIYRDQPVDTVELMERSRQSWSRLDREGLALIVETRTIDVPAGDAVIRFEGVSTGIVPQSVTIEGLPSAVLEQNADFDLLTPGALLDKSIGDSVTVVQTNPATGREEVRTAVVRSGGAGAVLEIDGRYEALSCSGLIQRVIFEDVPEGLSDQPSLSIRTRSDAPGRYTVTLAYLSTGLQWSTDYVARLSPDGRTLDLTGWLTLANFGGTSFPDAPVQVVAGDLQTTGRSVPVDPVLRRRSPGCWPQDTTTNGVNPDMKDAYGDYPVAVPAPPAPPPPPAMARAPETEVYDIVVTGSRIAEQGELGDYKIFTLPSPTTVAARQTKQVRFLERTAVPYDRVNRQWLRTLWEEPGETETSTPRVVFRLRNTEAGGLGLALPGGNWSLRQILPDGRSVLAGEAETEDRPVGLPLELTRGDASDVEVRTRVTGDGERTRRALTTQWREVEVVVSNFGGDAETVELIPMEFGETGFRITRQSLRSAVTESGWPAWTLTVPPEDSVTLTYRYEVTE